MMGSDPAKDSLARPDEQPAHQVCITQGYWLDAYEVTNAAYQKFVNAGGYTTRAYWSEAGWTWRSAYSMTGPTSCGNLFEKPQMPRACISWYEAEAYASWRGGRLPTEAEWEYAARGPNSLIYPWGDKWDSRQFEAESKLPKPVGSYAGGKSWVGAYDMAGNDWEWVADWYSADYYQQRVKNDPTGPGGGRDRVMRGGSHYYDRTFARAAYRRWVGPSGIPNRGSFRVVSNAKSLPPTLTLTPSPTSKP
jgi:formylglycine-generating enzyme required for sulfatase activity